MVMMQNNALPKAKIIREKIKRIDSHFSTYYRVILFNTQKGTRMVLVTNFYTLKEAEVSARQHINFEIGKWTRAHIEEIHPVSRLLLDE